MTLPTEDAGTAQRERMRAMSNPGAKQYHNIELRIDIWVDPETADTTAWAVAERVDAVAYQALEAAMKEIEAPDNGVEVVIR